MLVFFIVFVSFYSTNRKYSVLVLVLFILEGGDWVQLYQMGETTNNINANSFS